MTISSVTAAFGYHISVEIYKWIKYVSGNKPCLIMSYYTLCIAVRNVLRLFFSVQLVGAHIPAISALCACAIGYSIKREIDPRSAYRWSHHQEQQV
ncbi:hypothetical protein GDO81_027507 [Engystomops pustulosus]|uniref:Uncharacterized protein n=1 Tax=Engystomops pustulosus TaxID=76066 RepID=A0AAV6YGS8_ENGPU|nr:hypothetical protein GDO81_027507 [Engystomops pustulosus]